MSLKTIKIFIASSSELKEDRDSFRIFISVENDRLHTQGIYLEIVQWEYFLDAISDTRLQNEYNKSIRECDIALCLFFTKVGKYTAEEFDTAYQVFKDTGKPKIWTYFKNAPVNTGSITEDITTLFAFKKKIGELGHFYTGYTNIDNLINQFRSQLDRILPVLTAAAETAPPNIDPANGTGNAAQPIPNSFNEIITRRLMEAIREYSVRANKFMENTNRIAARWETQSRFSDPAKEIIAFSFVGIVGIQLRKLMAIGKEEMSQNKLRKYLDNCQVTTKRSLQLLCFILMSKLWDYKKNKTYSLSDSQSTTCQNFFDDEFEMDTNGFINLLATLMIIYADNNLDLPIPELNDFKPGLQPGSSFMTACAALQQIDIQPEKSTYTLAECVDAENHLTEVLENLKFLANYRMLSVKSIAYSAIRNSKPHYLYSYTALGIDNKSNINQEKINYADVPINTDAVLLYKASSQQNPNLFPFVDDVNLFPFIIDINALAYEGGAKICFYSSHSNSDGSLNYTFLEDSSIVNIINTNTVQPGSDINEILQDPKRSRDMKMDNVFTLFHEAKKAVTGIEDENLETTF